MAAERTLVAFLDGPDRADISNPIHSTEGANAYGFKAPLVGGVTVYGWCVPPILEVLGEDWLERGWADIRFRRPVYPGDVVTARVAVSTEGDCELSLASEGGEVCIAGRLGLGDGPWHGQFAEPVAGEPLPVLESPPELTLATAPVDAELRPMAVPFSAEDASAYASGHQRDEHPRWHGASPIVHPGWLAARMTPLLKHSFWYGPAIHVRSEIEHRGVLRAPCVAVVSGRMGAAYEKNGHSQAEVAGAITDEGGRTIAVIRHTTIFAIRDGAGATSR